MGLEGEWYCPKCEEGNYGTFTCEKCGYKINPMSSMIKGNPIEGQSKWEEPLGKYAIEAKSLKPNDIKSLKELVIAWHDFFGGSGDFIVNFGKYKGYKVKDVPKLYIEWAIKSTETRITNRPLSLFEHASLELFKKEHNRLNSVERQKLKDYVNRYYGHG